MHLVVLIFGAGVQHEKVADELDVAWLQGIVETELVALFQMHSIAIRNAFHMTTFGSLSCET